MQKLTITNLGPIKDCTIDVKDFMVFTGPQASGKSTIAKSIFFFNNLKNILFAMYQKQLANKPLFEIGTLEDYFTKEVQRAFLQSFGVSIDTNAYGTVTYEYDNSSTVVINIEPAADELSVVVAFDDYLKSKLTALSELLKSNDRKDVEKIRDFIYKELFASDLDVVYIPAGRSLLTMLSSQINYIYAVMDDQQKYTIDYCTQTYLEEVLRIKEFFNMSPDKLARKVTNEVDYEINQADVDAAIELMNTILHGEYRNVNGVEKLYFSDDHSVRMNYASSGQQEAVWITNILFYHMLGRRNTLFVIEEPESHLFPETQKAVVELISLVKNGSNKAIITTHSPYVLGSVNNLLYANHISEGTNDAEIEAVVPRCLWLNFEKLGAYFLLDGKVKDIASPEYNDIDHDVIDGVSGVLNETYEKLMDIARED